MEYSTKEEQLKNALERITVLKQELLMEKFLYANMQVLLKKREEEIDGLYIIINDLMRSTIRPDIIE